MCLFVCSLVLIKEQLTYLQLEEKQDITLCSIENNKFTIILNLSEKDYCKIKTDLEIISEYIIHLLVFVCFKLNFKEFLSQRENLLNVPIKDININRLVDANNYFNINRTVFNLLASFKFYLDHSERHIKRKFGKESKESTNFKLLIKKYFDNHFSYRLLYKLRVYALHVGFPIDKTTYSAIQSTIPEKTCGDFKLMVSREKLLLEKKLIGVPLKNDLLQMSVDIDIIPLVIELERILYNIEKYVYSLEAEIIEQSISNVKLFAGKYKTSKNEIFIVRNLNSKHLDTSGLRIPFGDISEIERLKDS